MNTLIDQSGRALSHVTDSAWQGVGAFLTALGIWVALQQIERKSLVIVEISADLLEEDSGREASSTVELHVLNDGNRSVRKADYEEPLSIKFGPGEQVLRAEIIGGVKSARCEVVDGIVVLSPVLLNAGDVIKLRVRLSRFSGCIVPEGRVDGVARIQARRSLKRRVINRSTRRLLIGAIALAIIAGIAHQAAKMRMPSHTFQAIEFLGYFAGFLSTFAMLPQLLRILRTRSANDVSLVMYVMSSGGMIAWICYGVLIRALPIVVVNLISLLLAIGVVALKLRTERRS